MKNRFPIFLAALLAFGAASADDHKPYLNAGNGAGNGTSKSYRLRMSLCQPASANMLTAGGYGTGAGFQQAVLGYQSLSSSIVPINNNADNYFCLTRNFGTVCITVPAGTYSQSVTFLADIPASFPAAQSRMGQLVGTPIGVRTRTVPEEAPQHSIKYDFSYYTSALAGVTDETRLSLMQYVTAETRWVPFDNPAKDAAAHTISLQTPGTGIFRAMEALPGIGVGDPFIYPNPFMPKNGDTIMRITNIPANTKIQIFTVTGRAVRELTADQTGLAVWDLLNNEGTKVASGIYLAIVRSGSEKHTVQLAIQR